MKLGDFVVVNDEAFKGNGIYEITEVIYEDNSDIPHFELDYQDIVSSEVCENFKNYNPIKKDKSC